MLDTSERGIAHTSNYTQHKQGRANIMTTNTDAPTNGASDTSKPNKRAPKLPAPSYLSLSGIVGEGVRKGATVEVTTKAGKVNTVEIVETVTIHGVTIGLARQAVGSVLAYTI